MHMLSDTTFKYSSKTVTWLSLRGRETICLIYLKSWNEKFIFNLDFLSFALTIEEFFLFFFGMEGGKVLDSFSKMLVLFWGDFYITWVI